MKKITKKVIAVLMTTVFVLGSAVGVTGCSKKTNVSNEETTLNIRAFSAGWGVEYIKALAASFQAAYAKEGYKVNIVSADSGLSGDTVINELLLGDGNNIDMYFTSDITTGKMVFYSEAEGLDMIAADLSEFYESKPIKADGTEEDITIREKLRDGYEKYMTYYGDVEKYNGKQYCFPTKSSPNGLIVNKALLETYGLEVPKTTDELINCFQVISAKTEETGVYPTAWAGYNAAGYWQSMTEVWVPQYSGMEAYDKYLTMEYSEDPSEGWKVYEDPAWVENLKVQEVLLNLDYAPPKTLSMDHTTAQHLFMKGEAVFMTNGAWLQMEMSANYKEEAGNMTMIATPVISALGVKLGLDGKGGADTKKCDTVLSQIVGLLDEGKAAEEIISAVAVQNGVAVTVEQVEAIREARLIYTDQGVKEVVVLNAFSEKLDIAKLFLRFIASDDGGQIMYDYCHAYPACKPLTQLDTTANKSAFADSTYAIAMREGAQFIFRRSDGDRALLNFAFWNKYPAIQKSIAESRGKLTAEKIMEAEIEYAKKTWPEKVKALGE